MPLNLCMVEAFAVSQSPRAAHVRIDISGDKDSAAAESSGGHDATQTRQMLQRNPLHDIMNRRRGLSYAWWTVCLQLRQC